jgi:glutamate racemase
MALKAPARSSACLALEAIKNEMGKTPVFGMVEPGIQAVLNALPPNTAADLDLGILTAPILILATVATVRSGAYGGTLRSMLSPNSSNRLPLPIIEQACPLLVPMIEEGWVDHAILHQTIQEYVGTHFKNLEPGVALLGCTHYPWIQAAIQKALPGWKVINSAQAIADLLEREGILGKNAPRKSTRPSQVEWIFTDPLAVSAFARKWIKEINE